MDKELSLEQIENDIWGPAPADATSLIRTVHDLRRKPIGDLEAGDIRILLGQQEGISALTSLALKFLESDPMQDTTYYAGDLLVAALGVPKSHWTANPVQHARIKQIIKRAKHMLELDEDLSTPMKPVEKAIENFA
ncbi:contact-dependent growth inhibition system immunity protein [Kibdelosporangium aridum]|uniref:contact-dependent growth inhibition system immunity protein n=1 Tax=Kibdelosporangium aridum TaxID=2030 RepID=UPI000527BF54